MFRIKFDKSPHEIVGKKPEKAGRSFLDMFAGHGGFSLVEIAPTKVDCLIMPVVEVDEVRKLAPPLSITQSNFTDERRHLEKRTWWWKEFHPEKTDTIPTKEHWERRYTPPKLSGYKRDISPFYLTPPRITQEDNTYKIKPNSISHGKGMNNFWASESMAFCKINPTVAENSELQILFKNKYLNIK